MTALPKTIEKNAVDTLIAQLEGYARDAADKIRSNLKNMDRETYMNFLDVMYHYTKGSGDKLKEIAPLAHNEELKKYFLHMAKEERGHYLLAQEDLRELGREVSTQECKEVTEFNTNWRNLAEKAVYGYLGACYVFENVAKHFQEEGPEAFLKRMNLKKTQARWVLVHKEADLEHGQEIQEICAKYGTENPRAVLYGAEVMYKAWVNVFIAATSRTGAGNPADIEAVQKKYGITNDDLQKTAQYTSRSGLNDATLEQDYKNKRWLSPRSPSFPPQYEKLLKAAAALKFDISSDPHTGQLLAMLASSKPNGNFLEVGTGCGLGTSWMLHGMCKKSKLTSIESDQTRLDVARAHIQDSRVKFIHGDASEFLSNTPGSFDLIFSDALPGKYYLVDETIAALKPGGIYIVDDCIYDEKWPKELYYTQRKLLDILEQRTDMRILAMEWASGITIGVKL